MSFLHTILGFFKRKKHPPPIEMPPIPQDPVKGTDGVISCPLAIAHADNRITAVLEFDFDDILSWAEYNCATDQLTLVQNGGAAVLISANIPAIDRNKIRNYNQIFIITRFNGLKIMHNLTLIVHDE